MDNKVSIIGRGLLIQREGKRYYAYPDPASELARATRGKRWGFRPARDILATLKPEVQKLSGKPWTCGVGITEGVTMDTQWDDNEIERRFAEHLHGDEKYLNGLLGPTPILQHQFDAFVSLMFNIGRAAFAKSTALRQFKAGNLSAVPGAMRMFNRANGKVDDGLVARRLAEANQFVNGYGQPAVAEPPPTPEPERSLAKSEINIAAGAGAVTAGASAVSSVTDAISGKEMAFMCVVIVALLAYIIYQRVKQRKDGWA